MASQTGFPSVPRVSAAEKSAGTQTDERRFSPKDVKDMSSTFAGIFAKEEGVTVTGAGAFSTLNFVGNAVTASDGGSGELRIAISALDGGPALSEDGVQKIAKASDLNFTGAGVDVTNDGDGTATIAISGSGAPPGVETQEEGVSVLTSSTILNFKGVGVTVALGGAGESIVTIPGSTAGNQIKEEGVSVGATFVSLNFVGAFVTVTDGGSNEATVSIGIPPPTYRVVTSSVNLLASDFSGYATIVCNSASNIILTLPAGVTANGPCNIFRKGVGEVAIAAGAGVTILSEVGNLSIDSQYNAATIFGTGTGEEYALVGKLKA